MASFDWKKKNLRFYQRRIDHNHNHDRNILRAKGGKHKTTKGVPRCYGIMGGVLVKDYAVNKKWIKE